MKKLNEIDQIKMIVLNHHQLRLFEFLDKPTVSCEPEKEISSNQESWSMLRDHNFDYKRTSEAFKSYLILKSSSKLRDKKFIELLD